jgi:hypothetical protein
MDVHDQILPDPAISSMSPSEVRRRTLLKLDTPTMSMMTGIKKIFILA